MGGIVEEIHKGFDYIVGGAGKLLAHGKLGDYRGDDSYYGRKGPKGMKALRTEGGQKLSDFLGQSKGPIDTGFGIGQQLSDLGIEQQFDPTSATSLGEAMGRERFKDVADAEIELLRGGENIEDSALWDYMENRPEDLGLTSSHGTQIELEDDAIENYWNDWWSEQSEGFTEQAKGYALSKGDLAGLDVGAKEWRDIANPLQRESTDLLRSSLGQIFSGAGGLKTGSSLRRREEAYQKHGAQQLDIAQGVRGKRQQRADTLAKRLYKAFGDTA